MAMHVPRAGFQTMLKEGAKHFGGLYEAVLKNITACQELSNITRTSLGPNGMNKMVINHLEKLFVTNDAATIIKELEVQHPAAKLLVLASQMQESEMGDATNLVIVLAGELLAQADHLLRMGLHPSEIVTGYEKAAAKALEILEELVCYTASNITSLSEVVKCIKTAVAAKQYGQEDFLANLIAQACVQILPKDPKNFNVDNVRVVKLLGGGVSQSTLIKGMVFGREVEGNVTSAKNAKVAVFSCPIDTAKTETKGTVLIHNANELLNFSKGEEQLLEKEIKEIADSGVSVVVSGGNISEMALHFLDKYNLMAVKVLSKFDLRRLCKAIGATPLIRLGAPIAEEVGHCSSVSVEDIGGTRVTVFRQDKEEGEISTIVVRGSTLNVMDDIERAIDDGVNVFKAVLKDGRFVAGGGATEIELAKRLTSFAETCPGLDQYSVKKFAESFEVVPRILAENAGHKSTEVISTLYAAHQAGKQNVGFDIESETGAVKDTAAADIIDPLAIKHFAIKLAANAAITVLRVDQIIMARPAGGPVPKENKNWDED
eukprot:Colp12_sorted_trinity150504_noHs@28223